MFREIRCHRSSVSNCTVFIPKCNDKNLHQCTFPQNLINLCGTPNKCTISFVLHRNFNPYGTRCCSHKYGSFYIS
uniref:Uncharacterized protein n=1 Tax=Onchocerca volvulus TaxID=6282 RepID=A0A8R1TXS1_ONCVO